MGPSEVAARLEAMCTGWVVIWSPWRRMFTAFAAVTQERLVIDEPSAERLLRSIRRVETAIARGANGDHGRSWWS